MSTKIKNIITVLSAAVFFFVFSTWCYLKPADAMSESERRPLATMPEVSVDEIFSGDFMQDFESYTTDQFPLRDSFRRLKALSAFYLFGQKDMNNIYINDGYLSKIEYPMNTESLDNALAKFKRIYEKYLNIDGTNVYFSIIPDKNYFMANQNGYPSIDYEKFVSYLKDRTEYMQYIDIFDCLELEDYYKTDTHWRQEKIVDVAQKLASEMGATISGKYTTNLLDNPFYGVYYGQSALPLPSEQMYYMTSNTIDGCQVYDFETETNIPVYDMEKANGRDPYEMYLSGSKSLINIKNANAKTDKKLIIFRDSFGSSIAPLLTEGYAEITLIDIRYISSELIGNYVDFENADVLFLYSTLVLNNSVTMK